MGQRRNVLLGVTVLTLFTLSACATLTAYLTQYGKLEKTARRDFVKGNYDSAVFQCVESLKLNPQYDKAQSLIQDAFRVAVEMHGEKIRELELSPERLKWDDIAREYEALVQLSRAMKTLPTLRVKETNEIIKLETTDYTEDLMNAKQNAAAAHYAEGQRLSCKKGKEMQKRAAKQFQAALQFVPGYRDAGSLYEQCRRAGIKRMAILSFEDKTGKAGKYGALSEMIVDGIISDVMNDPSSIEFLEIISRNELEQVMKEQELSLLGVIDSETAVEVGKILGVDEILTGKITQTTCSPERTTSNRINQAKKITVRSNGEYKEIDVRAMVNTYRRTTSAQIAGSYKIIDVKTARIKKSESLTGNANFDFGWATVAGDQRAVGPEYKALVMNSEMPAPVEGQMVNQAAQNLSKKLAETLKSYAR